VPGPEENNSLDVQSSTSTTAIIDHGWKPDALPLKSIMAANGRVQPRCGAQRSNVGCNPLLGFATMFHSYDYVSLFVSCFDIPVSLDSLLQRIASIYDRLHLTRVNKLFKEN
jgi:hypothetical protein